TESWRPRGFLSRIARSFLPAMPGELEGSPRAGSLAPDVGFSQPGEPPESLRDVLRGPHYTLLLFAGMSPHGQADACSSAVTRLRERYEVVIKPVLITRGDSDSSAGFCGSVLHDAGGKAHLRYGAQSSCLYLVRPDKYIAYRCRPADFDRLSGYLD